MKLPKWMRIVGLVCCWLLVLVQGPLLLWAGQRSGSMFIALGLMGVFLNPLRLDDERAQSLRLRALKFGCYGSFMALFAGTYILPALDGDTRWVTHPNFMMQRFGMWDAFIITFAVAQLLFWFWSYRDGVEAKPVTGWRRVVQMCWTGR